MPKTLNRHEIIEKLKAIAELLDELTGDEGFDLIQELMIRNEGQRPFAIARHVVQSYQTALEAWDIPLEG